MATPLAPPVTIGPFARAASWAGRIVGLDIARAIALFGMFAAHIGDSGTRGSDTDGWTWLWVFDGRASAIFAVLAGVTISLMVSRDAFGRGHAAVRIAVRGAILIAAGYALGALDTPVDVILTNLGLMFILVIPLVRLRTPVLLGAGALVFVLGSIASHAVNESLDGWWVVEKLVSGNYPALAWTGYVLVGMALGKLDLRARRTPLTVIWAGVLTAAAAYGAGVLLGGEAPWGDAAPWRSASSTSEPTAWWASVAPHADTAFELIGNTGVALAVIGGCVAVVRASRLAFPLLAFGSMSLTMYTTHVLLIAAVGDPIVWRPSNVALVASTLVLVLAATLWRVWVGAGPLEQVLTKASTRVADAAFRSQRGPR